MESLERLEDLEVKTIKIVDNVGEIMRMLGLELKQDCCKEEIYEHLIQTVDQLQKIGDELHDIIDCFP